MNTTLSPEARRAVEDSAGNRRLANRRYGVRYTVTTEPGGGRIIYPNGRYDHSAILRATVIGTDGTVNSITSGQFQLHCSCGGKEDATCQHLRAYTFYL